MAMVALFAARDWLVTPQVAPQVAPFRGLGLAITVVLYVYLRNASPWKKVFATGLVCLVLFVASQCVVLMLIPYGFRYGPTTLLLVPLCMSVLVTRLRELVVCQVAIFAMVQSVYLYHRPEPSDWGGAEACLLSVSFVTTYLGWSACRARREQFRLETQLRDDAHRDALTQLANRRQLFAQGTLEVQRARRYHRPLSVILFDIDHFKRVNDEHSHAVGDLVIQATAEALAAGVRDTDVPARLGGEEFVVLLPETTGDAATTLAERLRVQISETHVVGVAGELRWTVSAGVASLSADDADLADILKRADAGLYESKRGGRNRVTSVGADVATQRT
ncbi:MAG: GGDEF domain-containing protein [Sandaracinaceae bacterium]|nr:GGDEF domain-containing protein [Myxococcales bacterium]MCB9656018.1 GGDEF domain-containing protein [Sandaracinaceae bacterium]